MRCLAPTAAEYLHYLGLRAAWALSWHRLDDHTLGAGDSDDLDDPDNLSDLDHMVDD